MTSGTLPRTRFIGFDHLFDEINKMASHANDLYPPHNVVRVDENTNLIEMAVAGFSKDELSIEIKDNILTIAGFKEKEQYPNNSYIHKGISTKKFTKSFRLSEYTEVTRATVADGILRVYVAVKLPEEKLPKLIKIDTP
jgi:molecular chaperone IbpA